MGAAAVVLAGALAVLALADPPARSQAPPWTQPSDDELRAALSRVPVVGIDDEKPNPSADVNKKRLLSVAEASRQRTTAQNPDGFVRQLIATRSDLAGLPFRMGKDCVATKAHAQVLESLADRTRFALRVAQEAGDGRQRGEKRPDFGLFWGLLEDWETLRLPKTTDMLPALQQLLVVESPAARSELVGFLRQRTGPETSVALAQRVVFDLDAQIRQQALAALKARPVEEYAQVLVDALRYPWAPVAGRAAEAMVSLNLKQLTPKLVDALATADPTEPFVMDFLGNKVHQVRELVRVNHLNNCMLCHPASTDTKDLVRGRVPIPGETPPPPGSYGSNPDGIVVRADVTYLRQDFSLMEKVAEHGTFPEMQRFDYFVRTRRLTEAELEAWQARQKNAAARPLSQQRQAILFALRELTGRDVGTTAAAWRQVVRTTRP